MFRFKHMELLFAILLAVFASCTAVAQQDSTPSYVQYDYSFEFNDGVYTSFQSFRNNTPIPFENFVSPAFDDDFFKQLLKTDAISFFDENGIVNEMPRKLIWGYANNGKPYIYNSGKFNLIPYIGTISHFMTTELVTHFINSPSAMYSPYYSPATQTYVTEELVHYFLNTKNGEIIPYNQASLQDLISDDEELHAEYMKLSKRRRAKSIIEYMQKYNKRHPILFGR